MPEVPQLRSRLALVLLFPIFMRTTTLYECGMVFIITFIITFAAVHLGHRNFNVDLAKCVAIAGVGSLLANYVANFVVRGPWMRLCMAYLLSWDALWYLLPDAATKYMADITRLRENNKTSLLLILPSIAAGIWTIIFGQNGFLNTTDSQPWDFFMGLMTLCAIADPLQHLTIAVVRVFEGMQKMTSAKPKQANVARDNWVPSFPTDGQLPAGSLVSGTDLKSARFGDLDSTVSGLSNDTSWVKARLSDDEKDLFWAGGVLGDFRHGRAMELESVPLPEVQGRPSTRKRG